MWGIKHLLIHSTPTFSSSAADASYIKSLHSWASYEGQIMKPRQFS